MEGTDDVQKLITDYHYHVTRQGSHSLNEAETFADRSELIIVVISTQRIDLLRIKR